MNTREIAEEYRLTHWAGILRERKESGLSIRAYCKRVGMHENVYYYWQKKLRESACVELTEREMQQPAAPEGWALCTTAAKPTTMTEKAGGLGSGQVIVEAGRLRITVDSEYPPKQLAQLLRELMG